MGKYLEGDCCSYKNMIKAMTRSHLGIPRKIYQTILWKFCNKHCNKKQPKGCDNMQNTILKATKG